MSVKPNSWSFRRVDDCARCRVTVTQLVERIVLVGPSISGYVPKEQLPFTGDLVAALQSRDYKKAGEVLLGTSVFAVPPESQALVRSMVIENDRLWMVPREFLKPSLRAVDKLEDVKIP